MMHKFRVFLRGSEKFWLIVNLEVVFRLLHVELDEISAEVVVTISVGVVTLFFPIPATS